MSTKGGAGKSLLAQQIIPMAFFYNDKKKKSDFSLFLVDTKNKNEMESGFSSTFKEIVTVRSIDDIAVDMLSNEIEDRGLDENKRIIVDAGGGENTVAVTKALGTLFDLDDSLILIPTFLDSEYIESVQTTITEIKKERDDANICVIVNKVSKGHYEEAKRIGVGIEEYITEYISVNLNKKKLWSRITQESSSIICYPDMSNFVKCIPEGKAVLDIIEDNLLDENLTYQNEAKQLKEEFIAGNMQKNELMEAKSNLVAKHRLVELYNNSIGLFESLKEK